MRDKQVQRKYKEVEIFADRKSPDTLPNPISHGRARRKVSGANVSLSKNLSMKVDEPLRSKEALQASQTMQRLRSSETSFKLMSAPELNAEGRLLSPKATQRFHKKFTMLSIGVRKKVEE